MSEEAPHKNSKNTEKNKEPKSSPIEELYAFTLQPLHNEAFEEFEKSNEKLYFIEDIIDEDFLYDFYMDACDFNVEECIEEYIKNIRKILTYIKNKPETEHYTQKDWKKIYNYSLIDYSKPITYKYFKEILLKTPSLSNLLYAIIDISNNIKSIENLAQETILPINIDINKIFGLNYSLKIEGDLEYCCNFSVLKLIELFPMLSAPWVKYKKLSRNYWFWLWMLLMLNANYFKMIYELKNLTKDYIEKCELAFWNKRLFGLEDKYKKKQENKPINDDKEQSNQAWLRYRNIYNDAISFYQFLKFFSTQFQNKFCYEYAEWNYGRLILKNDENHKFYISTLDNLFECNKDCEICNHKNKNYCNKINFDDIFDKFKMLLKENFLSIYETLEEKNILINIETLCDYIDSTSKQEYALNHLKEKLYELKNISNKTILNKISNIEYELKHNKFKGVDFEKHLQEIKRLEKYEQINYFLKETTQSFNMVLTVNNSCAYNMLIENLEKLESLTKKSRAKN